MFKSLLPRVSLCASARRRTMGKIVTQRSRAKLTRSRRTFPAGLESVHRPVDGFMEVLQSACAQRVRTSCEGAASPPTWPLASSRVSWLNPSRGVVGSEPEAMIKRPTRAVLDRSIRRPAFSSGVTKRKSRSRRHDFAVGDEVEVMWHEENKQSWYASTMIITANMDADSVRRVFCGTRENSRKPVFFM